MGIRGELFSKVVQLDKRTYFFNVKENRFGDLYLNIVESKNKDSGGFDRQSVVLFADDLQAFLGGFDEALKILEKSEREKRKNARPKGRFSEGERSSGGRPAGEGASGERSSGGRSTGSRPYNEGKGGHDRGRDNGNRPEYPRGGASGDRTYGERGDRAHVDRNDRAPAGRGPFQKKPFNDRAFGGGEKPGYGENGEKRKTWVKRGTADSHSRPKKAGSVARTTGVGPKRKVRSVKPRD